MLSPTSAADPTDHRDYTYHMGSNTHLDRDDKGNSDHNNTMGSNTRLDLTAI